MGPQALELTHHWQTADHGRKISYYLRNPSNPEQPKLLFLHATGFHAMIWLEIIRACPKSWGICTIDAAGHGLSDRNDSGDSSWSQVADDAILICKNLMWSQSLVIGHSMGGAAAMIMASQAPQWVSRLCLIDPTVFAWWIYPLIKLQYRVLGSHFSDFVKKRRKTFASKTAMFERLKKKSPFSTWQSSVLLDYCEYGLLPNLSTKDYTLACLPEVEASYYRQGMNVSRSCLALIHQPVTLITAKPARTWRFSGFDVSPTDPKLIKALSHAKAVEWIDASDCSHFIPMEKPELITQWLMHQISHD